MSSDFEYYNAMEGSASTSSYSDFTSEFDALDMEFEELFQSSSGFEYLIPSMSSDDDYDVPAKKTRSHGFPRHAKRSRSSSRSVESRPEPMMVEEAPITSIPAPITPRTSPSQHTRLRGHRTRTGSDSDRKFACPFPDCPDRFARKEHLIRHLRAHNEEKPFKCDDCEKTFGRPDNLKMHKLSVHNSSTVKAAPKRGSKSK